jgi:hypothetical protein
LPPDGPLGKLNFEPIFIATVPELTISLSIITFSLSRTTVKVSRVAPGDHMVPGPFNFNSSREKMFLKRKKKF